MQRSKRSRDGKRHAVKPAAVEDFPKLARDNDSQHFWKIRNRRLAKVQPAVLTGDDIQPVKVVFADSRYPSAYPSNEKIHEVMKVLGYYSRFMDDSMKNPEALWALFASPTSMFWEIPGKALMFLSSIIPGHMAFCNLVVYHRDAMRQYGLYREMLASIMDHPMLQLQRVNAFVPSTNRKANWLARCLGFRREGILRKWQRMDGEYVDLITLGLLRKELENG